ncbi:MAG: DUF3108 domain-containing protein [Burkholderiaceae bacterium]
MSAHDFDPIFRPRSAFLRRRWLRLGVLSAAALALHAALLGGANWVWRSAESAPLPAASMQVRVMDEPAAVAVAPAPVMEAMPTSVVEPAPVAPPARPKALAVRAKPAAPAPLPAPAVVAEPAPAEPPTLLAANTAVDASAPAPSLADATIPHYRTQMPPAATLRYEVQRGALRGTGELAWRPQGDRYELKLDFKLSGLKLLSQSSNGSFDAAGIAPVRFTDQRLRRGTVAANFQRAANKITYSGSQSEFALKDGAQDRLSWMLQLAAIVSAEPRLAKPGGKVVMFVTGANGDAGVWEFRCVGPETLETRGGTVETVKFMREPREPHDTTVQVWLDPKQHDLPVRATQKSGDNDEGYELRLLEVVPPN